MLSRLAEWYRIVNVQPPPDLIDRRHKTVEEIVSRIRGDLSWGTVLDCVSGAVTGFEHHKPDSEAVTFLVAAVKQQDSAFAHDLTDNALELRTVCAVALGELFVTAAGAVADETALTIAASLESGLYVRPATGRRFLDAMLLELRNAAAAARSTAQLARRKRAETTGKRLLTFDESVTDPLAAIKSLSAALKAALKEANLQAAIDREELDILWWLMGGASTVTGTSFAAMSPSSACIAAGAEMADLCLLPPADNADAFGLRMLGPTVSGGRVPFDVLAADIDRLVADRVCDDTASRAGAIQYPALFPLTWLCNCKIDAASAAGMPADFERKTSLSWEVSLSAGQLASQILRERIAQRYIANQA